MELAGHGVPCNSLPLVFGIRLESTPLSSSALSPSILYGMADPITITTTVITLATALKDLVELAQNIRESFKKPIRNKRAVQALAQETLDIVIGLKDFYDKRKEELENASELRDAVLTLLTDMNAVYDKCKPILQIHASSNGKFWTRFTQNISRWWNRDDVEEKIKNLRDMANSCHRQFMCYGMIRIEAATAQISEIQATAVEIRTRTVQIQSSVADGLARVHGHTLPLRVSDEHALAFLGSAPVILSTLPQQVQLSEQLIYRSYITLQVGKIGTLFKALASHGSYPIEEPDSLHLESFRPVIWLRPFTDEEIEYVQSDIFALLVKIQENLKSGRQLSIQRGAWAMSDLSVWLSNLGMDQEFLTIVQLAVDLYRTLSKINEDVYGPHLAHALRLMSSSYINTGDDIEAYKCITEAVTLGRGLADSNPTFEAKMQLADLLSYSAYIGRRNRDRKNALKDAEESVQNYRRLIGNPESMLRAEVGIAEGLEMTLEGTHVYGFTYALEGLHYSLDGERNDESVKVGVEALELYRGLEKRHNIGAFSAEIAHVCSSLASNRFRHIIPVDQAVLYARESVQHYEKMLQKTGVVPDQLPSAMELEVQLLSSLERFDEAYEVCQKLARMIQIHMNDQELCAQSFLQLIECLFDSKRYAEAALTVESPSSMYRSLLSNQQILDAYDCISFAFVKIGDHCKSIQVAEASVTHWRMLTLQNPKYLKYVARSVFFLARRCFSAKEYERAFKEGGEALRLYRGLIPDNTTLLGDYIDALSLNLDIAKEAKTELESLDRSRLVVQYSRTLVNQFPSQQLFLIRLIWDHAGILEKFDHLADASIAISEALDWFDAHPAQDLPSPHLHICCLRDSARFLHLQGHPARALKLYNKAITIGQPFLDDSFVTENILWAKAHNLLGLYHMGHISIALNEIDDCLKFASENNLERAGAYTFCLDIVSCLYRCSEKVYNALSIIQQSIALDTEDDGTSSVWILSDLLADTGKDEEALAVAHKAIRETEKWMDSSNTFVKELHVQAQYTLALRLFASGELAQAQELLAQVRSFYHKHSKARNIWFINLAITLWAMGHLECASGRHEDGIAARTELNELRKRLRLEFPSLADMVEVGLKREKNFAAWKRLLKKYNLTCGHQDEEKSEHDGVLSESQGACVTSSDHVLATRNSATSHS